MSKEESGPDWSSILGPPLFSIPMGDDEDDDVFIVTHHDGVYGVRKEE